MDEPALRPVPPAEVVAQWSRYAELVQRVLTRVNSGLFPDDVLTAIQIGSMHLWDILDGQAVVITEIQEYTKYRQLLIFLVAGTRAKDWIASGNQQLTAFAKSRNCKYVVFQGRPGWERYARKFGYTDKFVMMRQEI